MSRLLHLLRGKHHHRSLLLAHALLPHEKRAHAIRVLVLLSVHHIALVRVSVDPLHRPRHYHRAAVTGRRTKEATALRDGVTRVEPVAAQPSELPRNAPSSLQCEQNGRLVVHSPRRHHAVVHTIPEDAAGAAPLGENASAGNMHASRLAIRCRDVHVGCRKTTEQRRVGGRVARKHVRINDETVIEGEMRIVKHTRAPLLSCSVYNVIVVNGNNNREVLGRCNRYIAIGDKSDIRLAMTPNPHLHVFVLLLDRFCID